MRNNAHVITKIEGTPDYYNTDVRIWSSVIGMTCLVAWTEDRQYGLVHTRIKQYSPDGLIRDVEVETQWDVEDTVKVLEQGTFAEICEHIGIPEWEPIKPKDTDEPT